MSAVAEATPETQSPPRAKTRRVLVRRSIILNNISWETFTRLLDETGEHRKSRFAYNDGELEILSPLYKHEGRNYVIGIVVLNMAQALKLKILGAGSMTCKRDDLKKGLEPDSSFYIQNVPAVRGKENLDLNVDPPPDLMIEVDATHLSMDKLPIYAALGVGEVWRWDGKVLQIRVLRNGVYERVEFSPMLGHLPICGELRRFLRIAARNDLIAMGSAVRRWVRRQRKNLTKERLS